MYTKGQQIAARSECWDGSARMPVVFDDGGRADAGRRGSAGDCVCRAIAIAAELPYAKVYDDLNELAKRERPRRARRSSARNGVHKRTIRSYLESLGWVWTATMGMGTGCRVHLCEGELPSGRLIVSVSKHLVAVIDDVIHDTHDPQRTNIVTEGGEKRIAHRCVYGYWGKP